MEFEYGDITKRCIRSATVISPIARQSRQPAGLGRSPMENRTILFAYLACWCVYLIAGYVWGHCRRLHLGAVTVSHLVPSAVAIIMIYVFLIGRGATVAQFVAGSESGMNMWSLWFGLWPILLIATAASGFINLVLTIVACVKKSQRKWIPATFAALLMSVFAFFTVGANFPDA